MKHAATSVVVESIAAGKLRRYHGVSLWRQLLDIPTVLRNIRDIVFIIFGFFQSIIKLLLWRPDVVFTKGGFVCLPVGYAASILRIPLVIHDSDAHPGLTNRLLASRAHSIATGAPLEYYTYPKAKSHYIGIPISPAFKSLVQERKTHIKSLLHLNINKPLVVVTGGGLGARRINNATVAIASELLKVASVVHLSGVDQFPELKDKVPQSPDYKLIAFASDHMAQILGAADVVVSRAGATTMLELAAVGAPTIVVPNGMLVGGHQLKNAKVYEDAGAAVVLDEIAFSDNPQLLLNAILHLLQDDSRRNELGSKLTKFAKPQAAVQAVDLILGAVKK